MRRPPSTVAGAVLVLLRVVAGVLVLARLALSWHVLIDEPDVSLDGVVDRPRSRAASSAGSC